MLPLVVYLCVLASTPSASEISIALSIYYVHLFVHTQMLQNTKLLSCEDKKCYYYCWTDKKLLQYMSRLTKIYWHIMAKPFMDIRQSKFIYGGLVLGSSQFSQLPQLPQKTTLNLKVIQFDSKIIILLR